MIETLAVNAMTCDLTERCKQKVSARDAHAFSLQGLRTIKQVMQRLGPFLINLNALRVRGIVRHQQLTPTNVFGCCS